MRIGIDAHMIGKNKGGVERYVRELVRFLPDMMPRHRFFIFLNRHVKIDNFRSENTQLVRLPITDPIFQRTLLLPFCSWIYGLDIIHVQRILPPFARGAKVVTVHDLLPLMHPQDHPGYRNTIIRKLTGPTVRNARYVLTVSRTVQSQIIEKFAVTDQKVVPVYNGIDHRHFQISEHAKTPGPAEDTTSEIPLLYIGAVEPRKNLETVLAALRLLKKRRSKNIMLTIAGGVRNPQYAARLKKMIQELSLETSVTFTGYLPNNNCLDLLKKAHLFLAPSKGEGFDLPPLEAMACGVPVVCSDIPVHRELFDHHAVFYPPNSIYGLAESMDTLLSDTAKRNTLRRKGKSLADRFTWKKTAWQIAEVYRHIAQENAA